MAVRLNRYEARSLPCAPSCSRPNSLSAAFIVGLELVVDLLLLGDAAQDARSATFEVRVELGFERADVAERELDRGSRWCRRR